eukprot:m.191940 g.191940  ORF g.191940 m.191940 type:complete len:195 (-) comp16961_c1_seq5:3058-3642(-)
MGCHFFSFLNAPMSDVPQPATQEQVILSYDHSALLNDDTQHRIRFDSTLLVDLHGNFGSATPRQLELAFENTPIASSLTHARLCLAALLARGPKAFHHCLQLPSGLILNLFPSLKPSCGANGPPQREGSYFALLKAKIVQHEQLTLELVASATFDQHCVAPEAINDPYDPTVNARGYYLNDLRWKLIEESEQLP